MQYNFKHIKTVKKSKEKIIKYGTRDEKGNTVKEQKRALYLDKALFDLLLF